MNKSQTTYLTIYILFLIHIFLVNYKSKSFYKVFSKNLLKKSYYSYLLLSVIISTISLFLLEKESTSILIISVFMLVLPLYFIKTKITVKYSSKEASVYRKDLDSISNENKATLQITDMTLYNEDGKQEIGRFYSSANLITHSNSNKTRVNQNIIYAIGGKVEGYPKGMVNMIISLENDVNNIFPPDGDYKGHIVSGTGEYTDVSGYIIINVRGDMRTATLYLD